MNRYPEYVNTKVLVIGFCALACAGSAIAQHASVDASLHNSDRPYVQATGEATISAKPDRALIEIGVISQAPTAAVAGAQNAKQTDTVITELTGIAGDKTKLRTATYSVHPNYQTPKPGSPPVISGYTATNIVEVTLDDLTQVSKVIDRATQSGANVIQRLEYRLKNPNAVRAQALRQAAEQAKVSAEAIASGLGVKVVRVFSAEEVTPEEGLGMYKKAPVALAAPAMASPPTPVEVGMIDVSVNVIVRLEIGQ